MRIINIWGKKLHLNNHNTLSNDGLLEWASQPVCALVWVCVCVCEAADDERSHHAV